ncbi:hypothetical protein FRUB_10319 [Fimbriiglobus ruber]|uniref:Uncharacterized protein n=2 Tax=Fimbriiglobus ruber TaxID=1908690 RepID=A0A225D722_9BACT|nr:hypothetical protein FRUB_10319 [Fimbriiglobus ruber]
MTVAFEIKNPFVRSIHGYRPALVTVWHVDPERDGSDDSCDWFNKGKAEDRQDPRPRAWWKHPRYHFWHWRLQIHPLQTLRRRLFSRCQKCGRGIGKETPVGLHWDEPRPRWFEWFRSERGVMHHDCFSRTAYVPQRPAPTNDTPEGT